MIEEAIKEYLKSKGITAKIYPLILPQNPSYPAITHQEISNQGHHDLPVQYPRIQITTWSPRAMEARQLAITIEEILIRYKGIMGGYRVKQIAKEPSPGILFDANAGKSGLYYVPVDYRVIYEECE